MLSFKYGGIEYFQKASGTGVTIAFPSSDTLRELRSKISIPDLNDYKYGSLDVVLKPKNNNDKSFTY